MSIKVVSKIPGLSHINLRNKNKNKIITQIREYIIPLPNPKVQLSELNRVQKFVPFNVIDFGMGKNIKAKKGKKYTFDHLYRFLGAMGPSDAVARVSKIPYHNELDITKDKHVLNTFGKNPLVAFRTLQNLQTATYPSYTKPIFGIIKDVKYKTMVDMLKELIDLLNNPIKISEAMYIRPMAQYRRKQLDKRIQEFKLMYRKTPYGLLKTGLSPANEKASSLFFDRNAPMDVPFAPLPAGPMSPLFQVKKQVKRVKRKKRKSKKKRRSRRK